MRYSHVVHPKMRYQYKQWHFMKYMQIKYMQKNKELFIYIKTIQKWVIHTTKMSYSYIINIQQMSYSYIQKKDLFIQRSYSWTKKELFIYKKKFLVIMICKKVSCTKMLYNCYKKWVIHTKKKYSYKKWSYSYKKWSYSYKTWVIHILYIQKMSYSYIYT